MSMQSILFQVTAEDTPFLPTLKGVLGGKAKIYLNNIPTETVTEVVLRAREKGCKYVATTSEKLLHLIMDHGGTIDAYSGSMFDRMGVEFLIIPPVQQIVTVPYAKHLYERYFSKFTHPERWMPIPEFKWHLFDPKYTSELLDMFSTASFIAVDIETPKPPTKQQQKKLDFVMPDRVITSVSFTAIHLDPVRRSYTATTVVVPPTDSYNWAFISAVCRSPAPKVFQGGQYDNAYFLRYGLPVYNWAGDTLNMFHSWYSELPKDLGFITGYLLRSWEYHKDESKTSDMMQYYQYNAKDSFTTALDWLALMMEAPDWAISNYLMEFPLVFPCMLASMRGDKVEAAKLKELGDYADGLAENELRKLRVMVGNAYYNPGSSQQTARLFEILGSGDIKSTGKIQRDKVASRHPLNKRLMRAITIIRENRKVSGTYLQPKKLWHGRNLYRLDPGGTDTSRLASSESSFWCGLQTHNIPRDREDIKVKEAFIADTGFYIGEGDYKQNETWGTAYITGDTALLEAVHDESKDFHGRNASLFFGVPYDRIVKSTQDEDGIWQHKKLDKVLRDDIGKRTNHGANYNMGAQVLLDTMGIENVIKAKRYLNLPADWSLREVTAHLLNCFDKTYPTVRGGYHEWIKDQVNSTHMLIGPTGWVRYCFGNPSKNKRDLNSYAAHNPQSLAAQQLNKAYSRVMYEVALPNPINFRLGPQIHDSIRFQYRIGFEDLAWQVKRCMEFDTTVVDIAGVTRVLRVPVDLKGGATRWSEITELKKAKRQAA